MISYVSNNLSNYTTFKAHEKIDKIDGISIFDTISSNIENEDKIITALNTLQDKESQTNKDGDHIIHVLAKNNLIRAMKHLLINPTTKRNVINSQNSKGLVALQLATQSEMQLLLLANGAIIPSKVEHKSSEEKPTPANNAKDELAKLNATKAIQTNSNNTSTAVNGYKSSAMQTTQAETNPIVETKTKPTNYFNAFTKKKNGNTTQEADKNVAQESNIVKNDKQIIEKASNIDSNLIKQTYLEKTLEPNPTLKIEVQDSSEYIRVDSPYNIGLDDIVGLDDIKNSLKTSIIEPMINEEIKQGLENNRTEMPNGIILIAPPGSGKTLLTKAIGVDAKMPIFEVSDPSELDGLIQVLTKNYEKNKQQRSIIYLRGLDNLYSNNTFNGELTNRLDRLMENGSKNGILFIASANSIENIPKSILTPGKIDKKYNFNSPDINARKTFIDRYITGKEIFKNCQNNEILTLIANNTQGFSIAQIKHILDDSVLEAITQHKSSIGETDILDRLKAFSKEQKIPEINKNNKTSIYDTTLKRYQPTAFDAKDFESIAGMKITKNNIEENLLLPWKNADKLRQARIQLPAGGVFAGDPGTSKTYMAKAIARSLDLPLYTLKMSEIGSSGMHEVSQKMGCIMDQLIHKFDETGEASVLLIDEIDYFQKGQSQAGAEEVNTLLQEIERGRNKVLFIGTTNEIEVLPDSLTRDGRLGHVIHFEHCDKDAAKSIIKNLLSNRTEVKEVKDILENDEYLDKIANTCNGMVAASVAAVVNDALSKSIINDKLLADSIKEEVQLRRQKDIEKNLSKNGKMNGHRLNITENSTLQYDTKYPREIMTKADPQNLAALGGMQDIKEKIQNEIINTYKPDVLQLMRENMIPVTKGFLLYGPPGCGKTTLVKAIANEMKIPLYQMNSGNVGSSFIHETAKQVGEYRDQLAYKFKNTGERSILFLDEAQQLVPRTSGTMMSHSHNVEEVNYIKDLLMSAEEDGIVWAMATNDISQIEPAFYENQDRLGCKIYLGYPDLESRKGILKGILDKRPIAKALNNEQVISEIAKHFDQKPISEIAQFILNVIRDSIITKTPINIENTMKKLI